jgi:hypothetical protein
VLQVWGDRWQPRRGVRRKDQARSFKLEDGKELKQNTCLGITWSDTYRTHIAVSRTTTPIMCCVSCVHTNVGRPDKRCCCVIFLAKVVSTQFVSSCVASCAKSYQDGVVIVPHDLIRMIHGLVITSHLQDELSC